MRFKNIYWLMARNSKLSIDNLQNDSEANIDFWIATVGKCMRLQFKHIQRVQNGILRIIANAPWFVSNTEIHEAMNIRTAVKEEIKLTEIVDSVYQIMEPLAVTNSLLPSSSTAGGYTETNRMPADSPPMSKKPDVRNNMLRKPLSKIEIELQSIVQKTQFELKRSKKAKLGLAEKLKALKKCLVSGAYKIVMKDLSPEAKTFFEIMVRESHKNPKGRRFSWDEKILALSLYKPSPKAYKILSKICVLPKRTTLNKLMKKLFLLPGYNDIIFNNLKKE